MHVAGGVAELDGDKAKDIVGKCVGFFAIKKAVSEIIIVALYCN